MSEVPVVFTSQSVPRTELANFFRGNPRLVKAFEDLLKDVSITLPDAIGGASEDTSSILAQGAFHPRAQPLAAPTMPDAGQMLAQALFARAQPPVQPVNDGADSILAGQIFGA